MTVLELREMLQHCLGDLEVTAVDVYGEGTFPIKGVIFNDDGVQLTGEEK